MIIIFIRKANTDYGAMYRKKSRLNKIIILGGTDSAPDKSLEKMDTKLKM